MRPALVFLVVHGLLVSPWPGLREASARAFRACANTCLANVVPGHHAAFVPKHHVRADADTRVLLHPKASGRRRVLMQTSSRYFGFLPLEVLVVTVLATPVDRRRRVLALALGVPLLGLAIVVHLGLWVRLAADALLAAPSGDTEVLARVLAQLNATALFQWIVPVVMGLGLCMSRGDLARLLGGAHPEVARLAEDE